MKGRILSVASACLLCAFGVPAGAVTMDYSNTSGSTINFNPTNDCGYVGSVGCFDFSPDSPSTSLNITSGSASGLLGNIDGVFGVGAISTVVTSPFLVETAAVSGIGTLSIIDGANTLTANLVWVDIFSAGVVGSTNINGTANLSNIAYSGSNADLLALLNGGTGIQTLTYQFTSAASLTTLFTTNTSITSTSFSGSITPVPVPAAAWLFGSGLLGLVGMAKRKNA